MRTVAIIAFLLCIIICGIGVSIGLNPRKWSNWLYGLFGFLGGLIIGSLVADIAGGIGLGGLFASAVMFSGIVVYSKRVQYSKNAVEFWLSRIEKERHFSRLVEFIRRLLNK